MRPRAKSAAQAAPLSSSVSLATPAAPAPEPAKIGRPLKLTPELTESLCAYIEQGNYLVTAANLVGIPVDQVYRWAKIGARALQGEPVAPRPGDPQPSPQKIKACVAFLRRLQKADAIAESGSVARMRSHGKTQWMAEATFAERRWPARWSRPPARVELSGPQGGPIETVTGRPLVWPEDAAKAGLQIVDGEARLLGTGEPESFESTGHPHQPSGAFAPLPPRNTGRDQTPGTEEDA